MKRFIVALGTILMGALPAVAHAQAPTRQHLVAYERAYQQAKRAFGVATVGCHLGSTCHGLVTDTKIIHSTQILHRMLAVTSAPSAVVTATAFPSASSSSLEDCIISRESGGDPEAENGPYSGIGQWSSASWAQDGGGRYASSPTQASYAEQAQVLQAEGGAGMAAQQGAFDGC
jgi:hypothetical protein